MEWRVIFARAAPSQSRCTALVQISDKKMILLVHISAMKSMSAQAISLAVANIHTTT